MKKIICNKVYDTEASNIVKKFTYGVFGDPKGYEETLYQTADGFYFVYENGGSESIHPNETIKRMSKKSALDFTKNH